MSSVRSNALMGALLALLCGAHVGCLDRAADVTKAPIFPSKNVSPKHGFRKGNTTLQMDVVRLANGDFSVALTALTDVPYVDLRTRSGDQWLDLDRAYDLKAGETQTRTVRDPGMPVEYLWAVAGGTGPRWVAQARILNEPEKTEEAINPAASQTSKIYGRAPSAQKLRIQDIESDVRKKVMY